MSGENTVVLITGANRGIGRGLLQTYLTRPNHTVIAGVRSPEHPTSLSLHTLPKHRNSELVLLKVDSTSRNDAINGTKTLTQEHGVQHLDIVIANAGISKEWPTVLNLTPESILEHVNVNVGGVVLLFQATLPLLLKGTQRKFVTISSSAASIGGMEKRPYPNAAYGPTKTMLNYLTRKVHIEHPELIAFPLDPGWVKTDMGNAAASSFGTEEAEISTEESVDGIVKVIDAATREKTSGHFVSYTGGEYEW